MLLGIIVSAKSETSSEKQGLQIAQMSVGV